MEVLISVSYYFSGAGRFWNSGRAKRYVHFNSTREVPDGYILHGNQEKTWKINTLWKFGFCLQYLIVKSIADLCVACVNKNAIKECPYAYLIPKRFFLVVLKMRYTLQVKCQSDWHLKLSFTGICILLSGPLNFELKVVSILIRRQSWGERHLMPLIGWAFNSWCIQYTHGNMLATEIINSDKKSLFGKISVIMIRALIWSNRMQLYLGNKPLNHNRNEDHTLSCICS